MSNKRNSNFWKWTSIVLAIALIAVSCFCFFNNKSLNTVASSFKGMTPEEIIAYVKNYTDQDEPHYTNMKTKDAYYQPMVQVVDYLNRNGFTVYVVSGTDRFLTRAYVDGALNIPMRQVIGSDDILKATNEDKDGFEYQLKPDDKVILDGEFQIKNVKMNKAKLIEREIGQKPVLAFGNTSGDYIWRRCEVS